MKKKLGVIGIDSGRLLLCDPCYIESEDSLKNVNNKNTEDMFLQLNFNKGHEGAGMLTSTGFGDGTYEVLGTFTDFKDWGRRLTKLEIIFVPEEQKQDLPPIAQPQQKKESFISSLFKSTKAGIEKTIEENKKKNLILSKFSFSQLQKFNNEYVRKIEPYYINTFSGKKEKVDITRDNYITNIKNNLSLNAIEREAERLRIYYLR